MAMSKLCFVEHFSLVTAVMEGQVFCGQQVKHEWLLRSDSKHWSCEESRPCRAQVKQTSLLLDFAVCFFQPCVTDLVLSSEQIIWPIRIALFGFGFLFPPTLRQCSNWQKHMDSLIHIMNSFVHKRSAASFRVSVGKTVRLEAVWVYCIKNGNIKDGSNLISSDFRDVVGKVRVSLSPF